MARPPSIPRSSTSKQDSRIPEEWCHDIDSNFEEAAGGGIEAGIRHLSECCSRGYYPTAQQTHILLYLICQCPPSTRPHPTTSLSQSRNRRSHIPAPFPRPSPSDRLSHSLSAIQVLRTITNHLSLPSVSLLPYLPTIKRGSAVKVTDYDESEYALPFAATAWVRECKGGMWDILLERKGERRAREQEERRKEMDRKERKRKEKEEEDELLGVKKRRKKNTVKVEKDSGRDGRSVGDQSEAEKEEVVEKVDERQKHDDEREIVRPGVWLALGWLVDLFLKEFSNDTAAISSSAKSSSSAVSTALLVSQLDSHDGIVTGISRAIAVIASICEPWDEGGNDFVVESETVIKSRKIIGKKLIRSLHHLTTTSPPTLDPKLLHIQLGRLAASLRISSLGALFECLGDSPDLRERVCAQAIKEICEVENVAFGRGTITNGEDGKKETYRNALSLRLPSVGSITADIVDTTIERLHIVKMQLLGDLCTAAAPLSLNDKEVKDALWPFETQDDAIVEGSTEGKVLGSVKKRIEADMRALRVFID